MDVWVHKLHIIVAAFFILYDVVFLLIKKYNTTFNIKICQRIALWLIHTIVVLFFYSVNYKGHGLGEGEWLIIGFVSSVIVFCNIATFFLTLKFDSAKVMFIGSVILICWIVKFDFTSIDLYAALLVPFLFGFLSRYIDRAERKSQIILASFLPIIFLIMFQLYARFIHYNEQDRYPSYEKIEIQEADIKEITEE